MRADTKLHHSLAGLEVNRLAPYLLEFRRYMLLAKNVWYQARVLFEGILSDWCSVFGPFAMQRGCSCRHRCIYRHIYICLQVTEQQKANVWLMDFPHPV